MLEHRLNHVRGRIREVAKRVGRDPNDIHLILVTKEVSLSDIETAYRLGIRDFGENRVQDLIEKSAQLARDIRWHFVGHLQTNKIKMLLGLLESGIALGLIHSLDRVRLAQELQKQVERSNQKIEVLIQVNASGEATKQGFRPEELEAAVPEILALDRLNVHGLMTIGPNTEDREQIRRSFRLLQSLLGKFRSRFPKVDWHYLSMGMSSDFEIAIEEGANLLRIGTAIFGPRL